MNQTNIFIEKSNLKVANKSIQTDQVNILNSKEDSKLNRIRKCFKEGIMNSTIHALPKIMTTDKFYFKIMWSLFFVVSFGFNIQLIFKCITDYLSYETITKIDVESEQPGN
jgi:hypothetical protein